MGPKMRMTQVVAVQELSPHMRRIVVAGETLADIPSDRAGAHVKVIFPNPAASNNKPKLGLYIGFKKWMRSYTVRKFDQKRLELTLDFAVNDHEGLASNWATQAKVGDYLGIAGSADSIKHTDYFADNHLFFGDLTALPVVASTLEQLPENAIGNAWIQVPDKQDIQVLQSPKGININWLVTKNNLNNKLNNKFLIALEKQPKDLTNTAIFIAGETTMVKRLKHYLRKNCQYKKSKLYASGYWNKES